MVTSDAFSAIVADDHELFRASLAEILRREFGFRLVFEASSLDEAIDHLGRADDVALATIDLSMPGMEGAASLHGIREIYPSVRIAVVTGSERREDILLALGAGVHGYIPKTLRITEVAAALRAVLEGRIFVPAELASRTAVAAPRPVSELPQQPQTAKPDLRKLSPRQNEVLNLMALGKSNKEIARELRLAEGTVKVHVHALYRTLGAHNRVGAVAAMTRLGIKPALH